MRTFHNEKGFTLLEMVIAISILSVGLLSVGAMQMSAIKGTASSRSIGEASVKASNRLEMLMSLPWEHNDLRDADNDGKAGLGDVGVGTADGVVVDGRYTIFWNVADAVIQSDTKTVAVIVQWVDHGTSRNVVMQGLVPKYV